MRVKPQLLGLKRFCLSPLQHLSAWGKRPLTGEYMTHIKKMNFTEGFQRNFHVL